EDDRLPAEVGEGDGGPVCRRECEVGSWPGVLAAGCAGRGKSVRNGHNHCEESESRNDSSATGPARRRLRRLRALLPCQVVLAGADGGFRHGVVSPSLSWLVREAEPC